MSRRLRTPSGLRSSEDSRVCRYAVAAATSTGLAAASF